MNTRPTPPQAGAPDDLVEQLRNPIYTNKYFDAGKDYFDQLRLDAANEIERLRTEVSAEGASAYLKEKALRYADARQRASQPSYPIETIRAAITESALNRDCDEPKAHGIANDTLVRLTAQASGAAQGAPDAIFRRWLIERISGLRQHQIDLETRDELLNEIIATPPAAQAEREPVAWRVKNDYGHWFYTSDHALVATYRDIEKLVVEPLYTAVSSTHQTTPGEGG